MTTTTTTAISMPSTSTLSKADPAPPDQNPALVYLASLSPSARRPMRVALDRVASILTGVVAEDQGRRPVVPFVEIPWHEIRYQHVAAVRARLLDSELSPSTSNTTLAALRGVVREAWRLGLIGAEEYQRVRDVPSIKGSTLPAGRALSPGEIMALVRVCREDGTAFGPRDAAVLAVGYVGGLRRQEITGLDVDAYEAVSGSLKVLHGKGRKQRQVFLKNGAATVMSAWIEVRGDQPGPMFLALTKGGNFTTRRMTPGALYAMCEKRSRQAGVAPFTPHDMRRSCAGDLLDAGEDIVTVQRHLGHSSPVTTSRYDRRGDESLKKASAKLLFPW